MATRKTTAAGKAGDAIAMLTADHKKVEGLFKEFESLKESGSPKEKTALVEQICQELAVHAALEEEIFYPAVRAAADEDDLMDEALVEHAGAKELIAQLQSMQPRDQLYDAKVTVLGEQIEHHVEEEEGEMFPKAQRAIVDTEALGAQMSARKAALTGEADASEEDEEEESEPPRKRVGHGR